MKKVIATAIIGAVLATGAIAQPRRPGYGGHYEGGGNWAPLLGGMIAGAIIYDAWNRPVYVQPQAPVYIQQQPQVYVAPAPAVVYDCVDTIKPSSVPGNDHIVRTCTPRAQ